ncbi:hypothetical protein EV421DRAFT_1440210 [Armillaria borealis]|uniref:Secreted protein n=1 Tax=Armillaria borealis TaxID=47425 RepID=A0AA39LYY2_9AGAR|nr:hypothetical protein EV421DRAFT_1440210 [Armillaria borealis]
MTDTAVPQPPATLGTVYMVLVVFLVPPASSQPSSPTDRPCIRIPTFSRASGILWIVSPPLLPLRASRGAVETVLLTRVVVPRSNILSITPFLASDTVPLRGATFGAIYTVPVVV